MTDSNAGDLITKKRKLIQDLPLVISSAGLKNSILHTYSLYLLSIKDLKKNVIIFSVFNKCNIDTEVSKLFITLNNLLSLSKYIEKWFLEVNLNEAILMVFLYTYLFLSKMDLSSIGKATIIFKFSRPFKFYNLHKLVREEQGIKFPLVKRDPSKKLSDTLQMLAEVNLRSRFDFVFVVLTQFYLN